MEMARVVINTSKIHRVPEALVACCVLGVASAAIGKSVVVQSGPSRKTGANLYLLVSARSGTGKTLVLNHVASPLIKFEAQLVQKWTHEVLPQSAADIRMIQAEISRLEKSAGGKESGDRIAIRNQLVTALGRLEALKEAAIPPQLRCEDVTIEQLALLLMRNNENLASISSDAGCIVDLLLGRYSKGNRTDEGVYLKGYSRDTTRVDRVTRPPVILVSPCLTVLWLVQPDKVQTLYAVRSLIDGGLLPRVMPCEVEVKLQPITVASLKGNPRIDSAWERLIFTLLENYHASKTEIVITPTEAALTLLNEHFNAIIAQRDGELADVEVFAARHNEWAWRIATVLHAVKYPTDAAAHELSRDTARDAIQLAEWFVQQQLSILSRSRATAKENKYNEVRFLLAGQPEGITATDVVRKRIVPNADQAHHLLGQMEAEGALVATEKRPERGGHTAKIYTLNRE